MPGRGELRDRVVVLPKRKNVLVALAVAACGLSVASSAASATDSGRGLDTSVGKWDGELWDGRGYALLLRESDAMMKPRCLMLLAAVALGACDATESLEPVATVLSGDGLRVTLTIEPEAIRAPGRAVARLSYENTGTKPLVIESGASCLAFGAAYRGKEHIPFPRSDNVCAAVVTEWNLDPGAELTQEWTLDIGGEDGVEVRPGLYRFVASTNTGHGKLEATFVVR